MFESDLQREQYAYWAERSALDSVRPVHRLLNTGHREVVVDADLSNYFGEIPHAELLWSLTRCLSDGRLLGWLKAWLEIAVEEDAGPGGPRRTNRARRERKGTPQGTPILLLLSNLYMRASFSAGRHWAMPGASARRSPTSRTTLSSAAGPMRAAVERMMERLRLPLNARKTRYVRVPEEPVEFLGYCVGRPTNRTRPRVSRHMSGRGERPQSLLPDQRVDASAGWLAGRRRDGGMPEPGAARMGELL